MEYELTREEERLKQEFMAQFLAVELSLTEEQQDHWIEEQIAADPRLQEIQRKLKGTPEQQAERRQRILANLLQGG